MPCGVSQGFRARRVGMDCSPAGKAKGGTRKVPPFTVCRCAYSRALMAFDASS